jgi:hypothetical protein
MTLFPDGRIVALRYLTLSDRCDAQYENWSRMYEYPFAIDHLPERDTPLMHNAAWGWEGDHVRFREALSARGDCVHSDILPRGTLPTVPWNMVEHRPDWSRKFDCVVCISAVEDLRGRNRLHALLNLWDQVCPGGRLVVTMDYPAVTNAELVEWFGRPPEDSGDLLTAINSQKPNHDCVGVYIVGACLEKV